EPVDWGLAHGVVRLVGPDRALWRVGRAGRVIDQRPVRPCRPRGDGRAGLSGEAHEEIVSGGGRRIPRPEREPRRSAGAERAGIAGARAAPEDGVGDRKSTRLNSSHVAISYAG